MSKPWRGIFVIVVTPFTKTYELDEESLRREIRFCIDAGAHGVVGPANASEFPTMSDDERKRWIEIVAEEASGTIPFLAGTTQGHAVPSVELSRFAEKAGADGIIAMPPHVLHPDMEGCYQFYKALSQAVEIPICIQNFNAPVGTPMPSSLIGRMCRELDRVDYVKEERIPEPPLITTTLAEAGDAAKGIFGGQGAMHVIEEHRRGVHGSMPASQIADLHASVWNMLDAGDEAGARKLFNQYLPLVSFERVYGVAAYKEVMVRRGIFSTNLSRSPGKSLDEMALVELDALWTSIEPLLRV